MVRCVVSKLEAKVVSLEPAAPTEDVAARYDREMDSAQDTFFGGEPTGLALVGDTDGDIMVCGLLMVSISLYVIRQKSPGAYQSNDYTSGMFDTVERIEDYEATKSQQE